MADKDFYDEKWQVWSDMKAYGPTSRHQRQLIHQLLASLEFESVMDTGCGLGNLLLEIKSRYPKVKSFAGLDLSPASVAHCQRVLPEGMFQQADLQKDSVPQQYDLTISIDTLEHIEDDLAALKNIHAMTRKYFVAMTIQGRGLPEWEARTVGHVRNYNYGELQRKLEQSGFKVSRVIEWGFPFYSPLYRGIQSYSQEGGVQGEYGFFRKLLAQSIYSLFTLNSHRKGDVILVLAEPVNKA